VKICYADASIHGFFSNASGDLKRILGATNFEVEVRAGGLAGRADRADGLTLNDRGAGGDVVLREVCIEGLGAVRMLDDDVVAVAAVPARDAGEDDLACGRGEDCGADWCREVDAIVAVDALGAHVRGERALIVANDRGAGDTRDDARGADRGRGWLNAVGDDDDIARSECGPHREVIEFQDFAHIAIVFLHDPGQGLALLDRMPDAGDREDDQGLARLDDVAPPKVVSPDDGINGYAEHLRNLPYSVILADDVYGDLIARGEGTLYVGESPGGSRLALERGPAHERDIAAALRGVGVEVHSGPKSRRFCGMVEPYDAGGVCNLGPPSHDPLDEVGQKKRLCRPRQADCGYESYEGNCLTQRIGRSGFYNWFPCGSGGQ